MDITPNRRNDRANYNHGYCKDQCCVVHTNNVVIEIYISIKEINFMFHNEIFTSDNIFFIIGSASVELVSHRHYIIL